MAKRLLIMALVAVQSASWSGASLFLCLGADGAMCIDGGPETCTCCHAEETTHACCSSHEVCRHQDQCDSRGLCESQLVSDPCDCTHVQIAQSQAPSVVANPVTKSSIDRTAAFVLPMAVDGHSFVVARPDLAWRSRGGPPLVPSILQATIAVAVINC